MTWTTPQCARLAYADALRSFGAINGYDLDPEQADREAVHALDVAPVLQVEGRVRPNNHAREIVRFSAPGGGALVMPAETHQREAVNVTHSAVDAFRRFGIVPSNRRARALDRCAAVVLRQLAAACDGIVVPQLAESMMPRVSEVIRGSLQCRYIDNSGSATTPGSLDGQAAWSALTASWTPRRNRAEIAQRAGLVTVLASCDAGVFTVAVDPERIDPEDEYGVAQAVAELIGADETLHPWTFVRVGRARVQLDHSDLIGVLDEISECPRSARHLSSLAGISLRQGQKLARRCGGIEGVQRLWHRVHDADESDADDAARPVEPEPPPAGSLGSWEPVAPLHSRPPFPGGGKPPPSHSRIDACSHGARMAREAPTIPV